MAALKVESKPTGPALFNTPERLWMAALLLNNRDQTLTLREFADISGFSLGFISQFSRALRQAGFLKQGRGISLQNPGRLLNIIRDLYFFENNSINAFYSDTLPEKILEAIKKIKRPPPYALTRMCGASLIAPFVRYQMTDLYVKDEKAIDYWRTKLNLQFVEISGNVNLIIPQRKSIFIQTQRKEKLAIVNNIQIYLDLYKYPARGREQAEHLREQVLKI